MPTDSRRVPVPDSTLNPDLFIPLEKKERKVLQVGILEKRKDGRSPKEMRPVVLRSGVVTQAKGSALVELQNTKVICAVYGPRDIDRREDFQMKGILKCEFKFAPFSCRQRRGHIRDHEEMEYSQVLTQALEPAVFLNKFPKAQVDVYVTVIENDGGALSAAIMAASLAMIDASIEMYDMVTAFTVRQAGKELLLYDPTYSEEFDPTSDELEEINNGNVTVALLPVLNQVSGIISTGVMDCNVLSDATQNCISAAQSLHPVVQKAVTDSVERGDQDKSKT